MKKLAILFTILLTTFCTMQHSLKALPKTKQAVVKHHGRFTATYYGNQYKKTHYTASGDVFNKNAMTCAAPKHYRFGTRLRVTNVANGKSVVVRVNDRGAFGNNNIDLTHGAFGKIANHRSGRIKVNVAIES